jgi:N-acetylmuramoyl-L-alanine amidase
MRRRVLILAVVLLADLDILANVVAGEAPFCPQEHQIAVAAVVLNRVADDRFPGTVAEVVGQPGQYRESYLTGTDAPEDCYEAARIALSGEHDVPAGVVYQANFPQGSGTWWISEIDTGYFQSTTYFCEG